MHNNFTSPEQCVKPPLDWALKECWMTGCNIVAVTVAHTSNEYVDTIPLLVIRIN